MVYIFIVLCAMLLVEYLEYQIDVKTPRKKVIHQTHYKSATGAYMRRANHSSVAADKDYYKSLLIQYNMLDLNRMGKRIKIGQK